jgi:hypothetical protein
MNAEMIRSSCIPWGTIPSENQVYDCYCGNTRDELASDGKSLLPVHVRTVFVLKEDRIVLLSRLWSYKLPEFFDGGPDEVRKTLGGYLEKEGEQDFSPEIFQRRIIPTLTWIDLN